MSRSSPWWPLWLGLLALVALVALVALALNASRLELRRAPDGGAALTLETRLPGASCRKELAARPPFVRFHCEPLPPQPAPAVPGSPR